MGRDQIDQTEQGTEVLVYAAPAAPPAPAPKRRRAPKRPRGARLARPFTPPPSPWGWRLELLLKVLRSLPGAAGVTDDTGYRDRDRREPERWTLMVSLTTCAHGLALLFHLQDLAPDFLEVRPLGWYAAPELVVSGDVDPGRVAMELMSTLWYGSHFKAVQGQCSSCKPPKPLTLTMPVAELVKPCRPPGDATTTAPVNATC